MKYTISHNNSIGKALEKLNEQSGDVLLLFVIDENQKLLGSITDGDIRRGLIQNHDLKTSILKVMNTKFISAKKNNVHHVINEVNKETIKLLPVVNEKGGN